MMSPWSAAYVGVISEARLYARAYISMKETAYIAKFNRLFSTRLFHQSHEMAIAKMRMEIACAQYKVAMKEGVK